jgi:curli biogenesis system outer membrane secretion channel CsgG
VAGRVHQVELVGLAVLRGVVEAHGLGLDGDPALALDVHVIKDLLAHLALGQARRCWISRSASVDLPWSICAMIEKLRIQSRAMERALADQGELQAGSNLGKGQVKAADYFLEPNIVTANRNSGGGGIGAAAGALGGLFGGGGAFVGGLVGGINVKKGEANVTLSVVNARTTEETVVEGYARKKDISWGAGGGGGWWGGFAAVGGHGYQNTEIGQVIVLAYLDAYTRLVGQLGGLPANASAAAPQAN